MAGGARVESEAKFRVDCRVLGELASRLGAGEAVVEEDVYYRHPCRDFAATDEALRLRRAGGSARLTYKGPRLSRGPVKSRVEVEVQVEGDVEALLERLGFTPAARVVKRRRHAHYRGHLVTLDEVEGLGCFVEVEGPDPLSAAGELGLPLEAVVEKTYLEMVLERREEGRG